MTERPPFVGESLSATLQQVAHSDPVAPRWLNPKVPLELQTICLKCLEKDPAKRDQTAQALAEELSPNLPRASAMLADLEASPTPPNLAAADFHSRRALELAPDDRHCREVRDRVSQRISQRPSRPEAF